MLYAEGGHIGTAYGWPSAAFLDQSGPKRSWVKLGRKKRRRMWEQLIAAVPVVDSRKPGAETEKE